MSVVEMPLRETADDVQSRAQQALQSSPLPALRGVEVLQLGEHIFISGRVPSFYLKQQAQELIRDVCDGHRVVNAIEVESQFRREQRRP